MKDVDTNLTPEQLEVTENMYDRKMSITVHGTPSILHIQNNMDKI